VSLWLSSHIHNFLGIGINRYATSILTASSFSFWSVDDSPLLNERDLN